MYYLRSIEKGLEKNPMAIVDLDTILHSERRGNEDLFTDERIFRMAAAFFRDFGIYFSGVAYLGEGANLWKGINNDPKYANKKYETILAQHSGLAGSINSHFGNVFPHFMVWGIGDGVKEAIVIGKYISIFSEKAEEISISVIDASREMLDAGVSYLNGILSSRRIEVNLLTIHRPFEVVPYYLADIQKRMREVPTVHLILGNTVFNETFPGIGLFDYRFIPLIRDCMRVGEPDVPSDVLVAGVHMIPESIVERQSAVAEIKSTYERFKSLVERNARRIIPDFEPRRIRLVFDTNSSQIQFQYRWNGKIIVLYSSGKHTVTEIQGKFHNGGLSIPTLGGVYVGKSGQHLVHFNSLSERFPNLDYKFGMVVATPDDIRLSDDEYNQLIVVLRPALEHPGRSIADYINRQMEILREKPTELTEEQVSNQKILRALSRLSDQVQRKRFTYSPHPYDAPQGNQIGRLLQELVK